LDVWNAGKNTSRAISEGFPWETVGTEKLSGYRELCIHVLDGDNVDQSGCDPGRGS